MLRSLSLALLIAAGGCSGTKPTATPESQTIAADKPFRLDLGESARIDGHEFRFVEVVEDSRCPEDMTCVWEGRAKVRLTASVPGAEPARDVLTLPYGAMTDDEHDTWSVGGMRVRFLALSPGRGADASRQVELSVTSG